jgi:hypothetical protein
MRHKTPRSTVAEISSLKDFIQRAKYLEFICLRTSLIIIESDVLGAVFICLLCLFDCGKTPKKESHGILPDKKSYQSSTPWPLYQSRIKSSIVGIGLTLLDAAKFDFEVRLGGNRPVQDRCSHSISRPIYYENEEDSNCSSKSPM